MTKVKVGFVGLGTICKTVHIPVVSTFSDVEILAASEVDIKRGAELAKKMNIQEIYSDYNKMFDNSDLDAVFVCAPIFLHYDVIKSALMHDIHVFCEKPMGLNPTNALELVELAEKRNLVLSVGYNRRLEKNYEEAARLVKSQKLGNITQVHAILVTAGPYAGYLPSSDWFLDDRYSLIYDSASHLVDLIMHVLDDEISSVSVKAKNTFHGLSVFDSVVGVFQTCNGTVGTFNVGWKIAPNWDSIHVFGTGGSVFANSLEIESRYGCYGPMERFWDHVQCSKAIVQAQRKKLGKNRLPSETYFREDRAFIHAVQGLSQPLVSGRDALRVLNVLELMKSDLNKHT